MENNVLSPEKKKKILLKKIKTNYSFASQGIIYQFLLMNIAQMAVLIPLVFIKALTMKNANVDGIVSSVAEQTLIATAIAGVIADSIAILILIKATKMSTPKNWLKKPAISPLYIVLGSFAILGTSNLNVTILSFCGKFFQNTAEQLNTSLSLDPDKPVSFVIMGLYVCLLGPILEEFLCRGVILNLCSQVSVKFGIFMSAMLFGFMHMNIIQGINAFVMGLILAYVATKSKSIIPSVIMHIFNNSMAIVLSLILDKVPEANQEVFAGISTLAIIVIGVASLIVLLVKNGKLREGDALPANASVRPDLLEELNITKGEATAKSFFKCISFYIVVIMFIVNSLLIAFLPQINAVLQSFQ